MSAKIAFLALGAALAGAAASAQPLDLVGPPARLDLTSPKTSFAVRYEPAGEPRIRGVAKTSVERRLAEDGLTGSLGFMCGLKPGAEKSGAAAMRGHDPTGRFVGARLSLAFR